MTEQERKEIYAQSELMRQQQAMNDSGFYAPEEYNRGRNSGGGVMSFGQDFGSPYVSEGLESAKMDVPDYSAIELGEGDIYEGLKDLETVEGLTDEYYQNVDKLKYLANTAASQGWNVTQLNFRDPNKRAISEAYRNLLSTTKGMGNMLKGGYEALKSRKSTDIMDRGATTVLPDGTRIGSVSNKNMIVDSKVLDPTIDDVNQKARTYYRSGDKNTANKMLEAQRQEFRDKANELRDTRPELASLYDQAVGRVGLADQNLDAAKLAWDKKKYGLEKAPKYKAVGEIADKVAMIEQTLKAGDGKISSNILSGLKVDDKGTKVKNVTLSKDGKYVLNVVRTYKDKKTGQIMQKDDEMVFPAEDTFVQTLIDAKYGDNAYLDAWNIYKNKLDLIDDQGNFSENAYNLGKKLNKEDAARGYEEVGKEFEGQVSLAEATEKDPDWLLNSVTSDGDARVIAIKSLENPDLYSSKEFSAEARGMTENELAHKVTTGEGLGNGLDQYGSIYVVPAQGFFLDDGNVHLMGVPKGGGDPVPIYGEENGNLDEDGTSKDAVIRFLTNSGAREASSSFKNYVQQFNNREGRRLSKIKTTKFDSTTGEPVAIQPTSTNKKPIWGKK